MRAEARNQLDCEANPRSEMRAMHTARSWVSTPFHVEAIVGNVIAQANEPVSVTRR